MLPPPTAGPCSTCILRHADEAQVTTIPITVYLPHTAVEPQTRGPSSMLNSKFTKLPMSMNMHPRKLTIMQIRACAVFQAVIRRHITMLPAPRTTVLTRTSISTKRHDNQIEDSQPSSATETTALVPLPLSHGRDVNDGMHCHCSHPRSFIVGSRTASP